MVIMKNRGNLSLFAIIAVVFVLVVPPPVVLCNFTPGDGIFDEDDDRRVGLGFESPVDEKKKNNNDGSLDVKEQQRLHKRSTRQRRQHDEQERKPLLQKRQQGLETSRDDTTVLTTTTTTTTKKKEQKKEKQQQKEGVESKKHERLTRGEGMKEQQKKQQQKEGVESKKHERLARGEGMKEQQKKQQQKEGVESKKHERLARGEGVLGRGTSFSSVSHLRRRSLGTVELQCQQACNNARVICKSHCGRRKDRAKRTACKNRCSIGKHRCTWNCFPLSCKVECDGVVSTCTARCDRAYPMDGERRSACKENCYSSTAVSGLDCLRRCNINLTTSSTTTTTNTTTAPNPT